jgi:hypothetical protein
MPFGARGQPYVGEVRCACSGRTRVDVLAGLRVLERPMSFGQWLPSARRAARVQYGGRGVETEAEHFVFCLGRRIRQRQVASGCRSMMMTATGST